jgi:hypothetical protein
VKLLALHLQQQHPHQFAQAVARHCRMAAPVPDTAPAPAPDPLSPPHHYEEVDASYLELLQPAGGQDSKRPRTEADQPPGRRAVGRRLHLPDRQPSTPQRSHNTRSFKRSGPRPSQGETYQGIAQPEPPAGPITGRGSESHLMEQDATEKENYIHYSSAHLLFRCNLCGDRSVSVSHPAL